jgi:hypothetical protein
MRAHILPAHNSKTALKKAGGRGRVYARQKGVMSFIYRIFCRLLLLLTTEVYGMFIYHIVKCEGSMIISTITCSLIWVFSFSGYLALHVLVILPFQQKVSLVSVKVSFLLIQEVHFIIQKE